MADDVKKNEAPADGPNIQQAPAGFTTKVGRVPGDGWLKKTPGQIVQGILMGRHVMRGMENDDGTQRAYYQIKLTGDMEVKAQKTDPQTKEKSDVVLTKGQVLNLDEHKALEDLEPYTTDGGLYEMWIQYIKEEKVKGSNKRTFWRVNGPHLKPLRGPTVSRQAPAVPRGTDEEDIPF